MALGSVPSLVVASGSPRTSDRQAALRLLLCLTNPIRLGLCHASVNTSYLYGAVHLRTSDLAHVSLFFFLWVPHVSGLNTVVFWSLSMYTSDLFKIIQSTFLLFLSHCILQPTKPGVSQLSPVTIMELQCLETVPFGCVL